MGNVVGIDLGTTYSAISRINQHGVPEIVTTGDDSERMIASVIYFSEDGKTYLGKSAIKLASVEKDTNRLVRLVKRYMGEDYYPNEIVGKKWKPSDLSAVLLAKMKSDYEAQFGKIDKCVISVPAYFDEKRRQATVDAGIKAGLPVAGIVNEPTAAALMYAKEFSVRGKTLVFDLGGGTFDVTLLDIQYPNVNILASQGDPFLGGADFDQIIVKEAENINGGSIKLSSNKLFDEFLLNLEAEDLKKTLSRIDKAKGVGALGKNFEISRTRFEALIKDKFVKIEMLIETVLEEAQLNPEDIENILLVGGSSRIPLVTKLIKNIFDKEPLKLGNVDEAVALGASIYCGLKVANDSQLASLLSKKALTELKQMKLNEVCTFAYSTASLELNEATGEHELKTSVIIPKNTKIPAKFTQTFYTAVSNQKSIKVRVLQGDGEYPNGVVEIHAEEMDLPPGRPSNQPIEITYEYDENSIMKCTFKDVNSGTIKIVDLKMDKSSILKKDDDFEAYLDF
jgi:molecular chaperone DnaK